MMKPQSIDTHPKAEAVAYSPFTRTFFKPDETEVREECPDFRTCHSRKADLWITLPEQPEQRGKYAVGPT
jgi:hypothetical protein